MKQQACELCNFIYVLNSEVNLTKWQQLLIVCEVYLGDFLVIFYHFLISQN